MNELILGMTGRIDSWKGHRYVIEAMARLKHLPLKLHILGTYHLARNPNLKTELDALIKETGMADKIEFFGYVANPSGHVGKMDVVLAPSDYEPFGLVAVEAMALKKPVIATRGTGFEESVEDGVTGFLVEPKNSVQIAEKIEILYSNPQLRQQFGEAGFERYRALFMIESHITKLAELYREALK